MRASGVSKFEVCCRMPPAWTPMLVAAHIATKRAIKPMKRRIAPLKKPPPAYAMTSTSGKRSIQFKCCFPRQGTRMRAGDSLSEPGAVSFLQSQPDLRHHRVHFGVRQGALRASESQGECDTLVTGRDLRAVILIECVGRLQPV